MKQFFGENSLWAPAYYLSLGIGIILNRAVGIHMSEFRPENEILGQLKVNQYQYYKTESIFFHQNERRRVYT